MRKRLVRRWPATVFAAAVALCLLPLVLPAAAEDYSPYARRFLSRTSDPSGNVEGRVYWKSDTDVLKVDNGSAWKTLAFSDANQTFTGTQTFNNLTVTGTCTGCGGGGTGESLLATATVNMDSATAQDVYTVPVGKTLIVTRAVFRNAAPDVFNNGSAIQMRIYESVTSQILTSVNLASLGAATSYGIGVPAATAGVRTIAAGGKVQARPDTAYGSAQTCTVDVFGYTF